MIIFHGFFFTFYVYQINTLPSSSLVYLPTHFLPSLATLYPKGQVHMKLPIVLVQLCWQTPTSSTHSSISEKTQKLLHILALYWETMKMKLLDSVCNKVNQRAAQGLVLWFLIILLLFCCFDLLWYLWKHGLIED